MVWPGGSQTIADPELEPRFPWLGYQLAGIVGRSLSSGLLPFPAPALHQSWENFWQENHTWSTPCARLLLCSLCPASVSSFPSLIEGWAWWCIEAAMWNSLPCTPIKRDPNPGTALNYILTQNGATIPYFWKLRKLSTLSQNPKRRDYFEYPVKPCKQGTHTGYHSAGGPTCIPPYSHMHLRLTSQFILGGVMETSWWYICLLLEEKKIARQIQSWQMMWKVDKK